MQDDHNQDNFTNVYLYKRKDGSSFPVSVIRAPIVLEKSKFGVVELFRDITEELAVDRAKTEFVSLASHQLRTPLSAINWHAEMLLDGDMGELSAPQKKGIEFIPVPWSEDDTGIGSCPFGSFIAFKDPDGNTHEILQAH